MEEVKDRIIQHIKSNVKLTPEQQNVISNCAIGNFIFFRTSFPDIGMFRFLEHPKATGLTMSQYCQKVDAMFTDWKSTSYIIAVPVEPHFIKIVFNWSDDEKIYLELSSFPSKQLHISNARYQVIDYFNHIRFRDRSDWRVYPQGEC